eukprot:7667610-Pyramimonas_sp.AAC.1
MWIRAGVPPFFRHGARVQTPRGQPRGREPSRRGQQQPAAAVQMPSSIEDRSSLVLFLQPG